MARRPNGERVATLIDDLVADLPSIAAVAPEYARHARRERWHPSGVLPVATAGAVVDEPYDQDWADPTGEAVVCARRSLTSRDLVVYETFVESLVRFVAASRAMLAQVPAMASAVNAGYPPTDGRTEADRVEARTGARPAESACLVCDMGASRVGGGLLSGFCPLHHTAWLAEGCPDRPLWVYAQRRAAAVEVAELAVTG